MFSSFQDSIVFNQGRIIGLLIHTCSSLTELMLRIKGYESKAHRQKEGSMKAKELSTGQHDRRSGEAGQQGLELECDQVK